MDSETRAREKPHVTKEDIEKGLYELGLREGCNVGVHSSLSAFGYVEGGADAVIDALLETVGERGTVVMPTYSTNKRLLEVSPTEKEAGIVYKEEFFAYDPKETPCWTGAIPDTFWRREGAIRGCNPRHSLAAIGPKADELSRGWDRLLEADGYILLMGVSLGNCSAMHLAERQVPQLTQYISAAAQPPVELKQLMEKYEAQGITVGVRYPGKLSYPRFGRMEEPCKGRGVMEIARIGEAVTKLFRLRELIDLYAGYLAKVPDMFYRD